MAGVEPPPGARLTAAAATPFRPDTVVLDVDGVLVDVEPSFREAVRGAVSLVQGLMGVARPWTPSRAEIAALKRAGGFNDDIHCTIALTAVGAGGAAPRLEEVVRGVEAAGGGLAGLRAAAPELPRIDGSLCLRVFDELYWGTRRFELVFGAPARHATEARGLVEDETPLVGSDLPARLRAAGAKHLALITGRTPAELDAALTLLGWSRSDLDAAVTGDEVRKPDPVCLDRILAACATRAAVYVGDVRDDWELVRRFRAERDASVEVRGVIVGGEAEALWRLGCDATLVGAGDLVPLLTWWADSGG